MNMSLSRRAAKGSDEVSPRAPGPAAPEDDPLLPLPRSTKTGGSSSPVLSAEEVPEREGNLRSKRGSFGVGGGGGGSGGGASGSSAGGGCFKTACWSLVAAVGLLVLLLSWAGGLDTAHRTFVKVEGTQFTLDCRPFYVAGFNVDNIGQAPLASVARKVSIPGSGRQMVRAVFQQAAAAGLNVVRTFAHTADPHNPLQVQPGEYSEDVFHGLDIVIAEAQRAGLRVILSLVDNWKYHGGVDEYVDWSSSAPPRDPQFPPVNKLGDFSVEDYSPERLAYENKRKVHFYRDDACRKMYKSHVRAVLERRNSVTGVVYRDDPAIMAFNLINEPRCSAYETPECADVFQKWVHDMAMHFKSLDQQHLLTVGAEGFWGERDGMKSINPGAPGSDWASKAGQDFIPNHQLPTIDFASVHLWPDNWNIHNHTFHRQWLDKHIEDGDVMLKKPVLVEEFGKVLGRGRNPPPQTVAQHRDPVFANVYDAVEGAIGHKKAAGGSLYWRWGFNVYQNDLPGPYGVLPEHSTFQLISQHAQRVRAFMNTQPPRHECQLECWLPAKSAFGMLRRCEHRPSVCADQRNRRQYQKAFEEGSNQLVSHGRQVFASQAECCRPGLGGFAEGCNTTWF